MLSLIQKDAFASRLKWISHR